MMAKDKSKDKKRKLSKSTKTMIAVIAAVVILVGGLLAVVFYMPACNDESEEGVVETTYPTDSDGKEYAVDSKGNRIENDEGVSRDNNGNIVSDGVVNITTQGPFGVERIDIENESGTYTILSETPVVETTDADGNETTETQETVYTLVGFEDAELQAGQADSIANQASNMSTTRIIDIKGENLSDYGLDDPRAKVKTTFTDGTTVAILIGDDAPDSLGTYIKYEDKDEVYMTDVDSVNAFLFSALDLLSKEITEAAQTEDDAEIVSLTLSGSHYPEEITMVPNDDETCAAYYKMTSPKEQFVNVTEGNNVKGGIRGLSATAVASYHPSDDQLDELGLLHPYARVVAQYADVTYRLSASKPDESGNVYIYNEDKQIAYQIADTSVAWVSSSYESLKYEYVLKPAEDTLSAIEVTANGETYRFELEQVTTTDDDGNEQKSMRITYGDEQIAESKFSTFFDNLTGVQRSDSAESENPSGSAVLTVRYTYNNGKSADTVSYYSAGNRKMLAQINGNSDSHVFKSYTDKIAEDVVKITNGQTVSPI